LKDTSQAVIPAAGGSGAFGKGLQVMKVRNAGEAAWAKRQGRSFNDKQRKEAVRTRVGFVHNNQKRQSFLVDASNQRPLTNLFLSTDFRDPMCEFIKPAHVRWANDLTCSAMNAFKDSMHD